MGGKQLGFSDDELTTALTSTIRDSLPRKLGVLWTCVAAPQALQVKENLTRSHLEREDDVARFSNTFSSFCRAGFSNYPT